MTREAFSAEEIKQVLSAYQPDRIDNRRGFRPASVLIPFYCHHGELSLIFIKRTEAPGPHGGQISFPGGARDEADKDDLCTALRETEEEIGVDRNQIEVWGELIPSFTEASKYWVTPFVGKIPSPHDFHPNSAEVERLFFIPLTHLLDRSHFSIESCPWKHGLYTTYIFRYGKETIWGLTAQFLNSFLTLLRHGKEIRRE
jgi:8-oxo-dGTP pyrophosphatase MutT (NUDIX family)